MRHHKKREPDFRPAPGENKFLIHFDNNLVKERRGRQTPYYTHGTLRFTLNNDTILTEAWEAACHHYWGQVIHRRFSVGLKA